MRYQEEKNPVKIQSTLSFESKLSPAYITQGKKVEIDMLKLSDLPGVMRNMGWVVASKLMERWFQGDAFVLHEDLRKHIMIIRSPCHRNITTMRL